MSEAVEKRRARFSPEVLAQMQKLGQMISAETYGEGGPPLELTWAEIEELGHEIGKLTATVFDQTAQRQQAERYDTSRGCPQCGKACRASVKHRDLTTRDGTADLSEPEFRCVACERSFFPQRIELRLDGSDYSPAVLERIVKVGGSPKSVRHRRADVRVADRFEGRAIARGFTG